MGVHDAGPGKFRCLLILGMMTNDPMASSIIRTAVTMRTATPSAGARS
jgi:hypothetical protein